MEVEETLKKMGIEYTIKEHPAVETIAAMEELGLPHMEYVAKNLFLRDDKKRCYYLVVVQKDKTVNLKGLRSILGSRPLTFASENDLFTYLGLQKGSVTPLGILNDKAQKVEVVLDKDLREFPLVGVHPNRNTATIWLKVPDLLKLIEKQGNKCTIVELGDKEKDIR